MSCRNSVVRMVVKVSDTAGVVPTIPASDDHTDGSWLATDIYIGEQFFNSADGIMYTRSDNGITVVGSNNPNGIVKRYVANFTQTGTNAPDVIELENTIGAIVWTRAVAGNFVGTLSGAFPNADYVAFSGVAISYGSSGLGIIVPYWTSVNTVQVDSGLLNTGVSSDDLMTLATIIIEIYPEPPIS